MECDLNCGQHQAHSGAQLKAHNEIKGSKKEFVLLVYISYLENLRYFAFETDFLVSWSF